MARHRIAAIIRERTATQKTELGMLLEKFIHLLEQPRHIGAIVIGKADDLALRERQAVVAAARKASMAGDARDRKSQIGRPQKINDPVILVLISEDDLKILPTLVPQRTEERQQLTRTPAGRNNERESHITLAKLAAIDSI